MPKVQGCLVLLLTILWASLHAESELDTKSSLGMGSGLAMGELKHPQNNYLTVPLSLHIGFDLNRACGFSKNWGRISLAFEPFWNSIIDPSKGIEAGLSLKFYYDIEYADCWGMYLEAGAGPGYLSIDTKEQDAPGFNFFDEGGGGFRYYVDACTSLNLGYRIRHISHGGARDTSNGGIDSHAAVISFTTYH